MEKVDSTNNNTLRIIPTHTFISHSGALDSILLSLSLGWIIKKPHTDPGGHGGSQSIQTYMYMNMKSIDSRSWVRRETPRLGLGLGLGLGLELGLPLAG